MKNSDQNTEKGNIPGPAGSSEESKPIDYLKAMRSHIRRGEEKTAFQVMQKGYVQFPEDPVIMSFYGSLQATVDKKYRSGIENCRKALGTLKKKGVKDEAFYPVFYFNLGKAYLAASKKKEAIEAFNSGLKYDPRNRDIQKELQHIGYRKKPPVPFLDRSNPINKYIGKLVSKKSGKNTGRGSA